MKNNKKSKPKKRNWNDYIKELLDIKDEIPETNIKAYKNINLDQGKDKLESEILSTKNKIKNDSKNKIISDDENLQNNTSSYDDDKSNNCLKILNEFANNEDYISDSFENNYNNEESEEEKPENNNQIIIKDSKSNIINNYSDKKQYNNIDKTNICNKNTEISNSLLFVNNTDEIKKDHINLIDENTIIFNKKKLLPKRVKK